VIEGLPGLFCMTDEEGTILRWNRQQETVLGYSQEDLVRMKAWDYVDAELRAPFAQVFADGDGNGPKEQETVLLTKDGKKLPCLMTRLKKNIGGKYYLFSIGTDISELKQIENDLRTSRDQLRMLAGRLESVREEERTLIAREIHDQLGQDLTGIKMNVSLLSKKLCKACAEKENFSYTNELINNAIHSVRKIATDLRPSVLDELGLVAAIEWQAREFERQTGIACTVSIADRHLEVEQGRSTAFFRILQEALTNVARHANASAAQVSFGSLNCAYRLRIEDNGKGISPREVEEPTSLGILGMKERALPFGGTVTISGRDGKGTQVLAHFPMEES